MATSEKGDIALPTETAEGRARVRKRAETTRRISEQWARGGRGVSPGLQRQGQQNLRELRQERRAARKKKRGGKGRR